MTTTVLRSSDGQHGGHARRSGRGHRDRALGVVAFDLLHTGPDLSLAIDSGDDIDTTLLLLIAGVVVGTIATDRRVARAEAGSAHTEIRRIHRVAEASVSGRDVSEVIAIAQGEPRQRLSLADARFDAFPTNDLDVRPRMGRNGAIEGVTARRFRRNDEGRTGFELPAGGETSTCWARGRPVGRFLLVPQGDVAVSLEQRLVAAAIADQVAATSTPNPP